ncbi:MAG: hypothetical protein WBP59_00550 [Ilumatobacteraceae bacterium]
MRRSPGGLLLIVAGVFFALAIGSLWLQRVAFTPSDDSTVARSILSDEDIRSQVATVIASADAPVLSQSPAQLKEFIDDIALIPDGAALMSGFVHDAHARLIGASDELVLVTAEEQVTIVRDELVGEAESLTLPVQRVGSVSFLDSWSMWFALGCLGLSLVLGLAGILLRPERGEATFALGVMFGATAVSIFVLGYLVPLVLLPALSDDPWMGVFPQLAKHHRNLTLLLTVIALAIAALIVFGTSSRRQRRQHSTPLNVGRYREERSWSR